MSTPTPQGTLDLLILQTLVHGPRHAYGIARWLEQTTDDGLAVEEGALYPALYRMWRRGWIRAAWRQSDSGKDIKVYELTADGKAELKRRTTDWTAVAAAMAKVL